MSNDPDRDLPEPQFPSPRKPSSEVPIPELPANAAVFETVQKVAAPAATSDLCVFGKSMSGLRLIGMLLINLLTAVVLVVELPDSAKLMVSVFFLSLAYGLWKQWKSPPMMQIQEGQAALRLLGTSYRTPVMNLADVVLEARKLCLRFHEIEKVDVPNAEFRKALSKNFSKTGYHLVVPDGVFDLGQVNQLRECLGLDPQSSDERGNALARFETELKRTTRSAWVTPTLIGINVLVFIGLFLQNYFHSPAPGSLSGNLPLEVMLNWGANYGPITAAGESWRLFTSLFLHWSVVHLIFNMWVLNDVGRLVERLIGNGAYLMTYLLSGVCGSIASVVWNRPVVSAGASGAVFGVFGLLLGLLVRRRHEFPVELLRQHRASCIGFLVFNLLAGFAISNIDLAAHLGGIVGGLVCGLLISPTFSKSTFFSSRVRLALLSVVCFCVTGFGLMFLPLPNADLRFELRKVFSIEQRVAAAYQSAMQDLDSGRANAAATRETMQRDVTVPWHAAYERLSSLKNVAAEDLATIQAISEFMKLREESWDLLTQGTLEQNAVTQGLGLEKIDAAFDVFRRWAEADGRRLGFQVAVPNLPTDEAGELLRFAAVEDRVMTRYGRICQESKDSAVSDAQFAAAIEQDVLPGWRAGHERLRQFALQSGEVKSTPLEKMLTYMELRQQSWELLAEGLRDGRPDKIAEGKKKWAEVERMAADMSLKAP